jgi:hypothetical protein
VATEPVSRTSINAVQAGVHGPLLFPRDKASGLRHHREENQMTQAAIPLVPAPTGAEADIWQDDNPLSYRVVYGQSRGIAGRDEVIVGTAALQFTDGRVDDGTVLETPHVCIEVHRESGLTCEQTSDLAATILEGADQVEGWCGR